MTKFGHPPDQNRFRSLLLVGGRLFLVDYQAISPALEKEK